VHGDIIGTWRRADADVRIHAWRRLSRNERDVVEAEARSLPLPDIGGEIRIRWD
jgi:hypothetical protein